MALNFLTNRLKALLLIFLGAFRRALCCFRKRRRSSCSPIPLTAVGVVPDSTNNSSGREDGSELHSWNSWEDGSSPDSVITDVGHNIPVNSIQQHIELYRQSQMRQPVETEMGESSEDYFQDMTPRITRQQKVLVSTSKREEGEGEESPGGNMSGSGVWSPRLAVSSVSIPYLNSSELEAWEDRGGDGWDEAAGAEAWEQARALRQAKRAAEQQQRRREREGKARLGARVGGSS